MWNTLGPDILLYILLELCILIPKTFGHFFGKSTAVPSSHVTLINDELNIEMYHQGF
jgi:hypothetical protein